MNRRKLKKAAYWLMGRYASIGGEMTRPRAEELITDLMGVVIVYGPPGSRSTYRRAAEEIWSEELADWNASE